jgi:hypothetical protein
MCYHYGRKIFKSVSIPLNIKSYMVFIIFCLVLFLFTWIKQSFSAERYHRYEWIFEPNVDGSVHIEWGVTICCEEKIFSTSWRKNRPIKNVEVRDAETGESLKATLTDEGNRIKLQIELDEKGKSGYQFIVELDRSNK